MKLKLSVADLSGEVEKKLEEVGKASTFIFSFYLDAMEAEAIAAGLGAADLGSRNDPNRQGVKEEERRSEDEKRNSAYQVAKAKADENSRALRMEQTLSTKKEDADVGYFADDAEDY